MYPVQYHKEGLHQYVYFPIGTPPEGGYINQLFQYHQVPGFLNYEIKELNNQYYIYYLLKYKTSIGFLKDYLSFGEDVVEEMVRSIIDILGKAKNYLLSYQHIIWSADYVFINVETGQLQFCYCPVPLDNNDLCSFLSELLRLVGKKNESAMILLLELYNCITEPGFQEKQLSDFWKNNLDYKKQEKTDEDIKSKEIIYEKKPEDVMDGKELQQNKNHAITKEIIWNVSVIILGIINVLVLCLLLTGILDNQYFPVMIVLFILLCIRLGISILEKQEDETDIIMKEYFHKIEDIEEQHKEKSIVYNQNKKNKEDENQKAVYGETTVLTMEDSEKEMLVVEEFPKEMYLLPCEKNQYPILEIKHHSVVIGCMREHCDYVLEGRGVSRLHAKIMRVDTMLYLLDLNSTNGTFLNGERLESGKDYLLEKGDVVAFSQIEFYVGEKPNEKEIY